MSEVETTSTVGTTEATVEVDTHDHDHEGEGAKILWLFIMFAICYFGILPKAWPKCRDSQTFLSLLNAYAGGIFLAVAFMHIAPHSIHAFDRYRTELEEKNGPLPEGAPFPLPFVFLFAGYYLILFIDQVIAGKFHKQYEEMAATSKGTSAPAPVQSADETPADDSKRGALEIESAAKPEGGQKISTVSAYVLVASIGFHALFEGIAVGLLEDSVAVHELGLGIALHKLPAAVALGASFTNAGMSLKQVIGLITLFAVLTPLGQLIGMYLLAETNAFVDMLMMSLTAGTFVYVACTEMIQKEFAKGEHQVAKFVLLCLGCVTIGLTYLFHSH